MKKKKAFPVLFKHEFFSQCCTMGCLCGSALEHGLLFIFSFDLHSSQVVNGATGWRTRDSKIIAGVLDIGKVQLTETATVYAKVLLSDKTNNV